MELLSVESEAEWEQFLGKLFKKVGRALKPLGGALRGIAKKALPFVGGALGSFIPIPGVGTAIGTALGSAVGKALELEYGELESDEAELEIARRVVRIAASAARSAGMAPVGAGAEAVMRNALLAAARAHVPAFAENEHELVDEAESAGEDEGSLAVKGGAAATSGRWRRQGRTIVLQGI